MSDGKLEILRRGRWTSAQLDGYVFIVRQDWDYYHEAFYDDGPDLNKEGWAYYAIYSYEPNLEGHIARSSTCLSEIEAMKLAESAFEIVRWD